MSFREAYPEGARDFTLGESIWFALTSLTPQGGGECPKVIADITNIKFIPRIEIS